MIPTSVQVRERVDHSGDLEMAHCMRTQYLMCARTIEVVGESYPSDPYEAMGPRGNHAKRLFWEWEKGKEPAWVVSILTAKRDGLERLVGVAPDFDPWVRALADYFDAKGEELVFPFSRKDLGDYVRSNGVFEGFEWPVQNYWKLVDPGLPRGTKERNATVEAHFKPFSVENLRDVRATVLTGYFGFDGFELAIHGGWSLPKTAQAVSPVMSRYQDHYHNWKRPFPKLLKPLPTAESEVGWEVGGWRTPVAASP